MVEVLTSNHPNPSVEAELGHHVGQQGPGFGAGHPVMGGQDGEVDLEARP